MSRRPRYPRSSCTSLWGAAALEGPVEVLLVDVVHRGQRWVWERPDPFGDHAHAAGDGTLLAPMPGTVLAVAVEEGQSVAEGETLGVMEAMKMELALKAPRAGVLAEVRVQAGDFVEADAVLATLED